MKLKSFRSPEAIFNARNRNLFHCLFISVALILSSVANDLVAQSKGPAAGNGNASTLLQQKTGQGFEPLSYCTATNICDPTLYISRVVFGSLDNSSACSALGYGDYTTSVAAPAIEAGKTTILSITIPTAQFNMIGAWIDLNKNNSFEANEFFFIGSTAGGVINTPISIPLSTSPGQTRMRIRRLYYSNPMTFDMACGMNGYPGETEDYTINIVVPKVAFIHTPLSNPDTLYKPTITISATILQSDAGINNSDSLKPRLWARKVGSTSWKQVKGNLVSGNVTNGNWDFVISHDSLGIRKNDCEQVQYYFVAQDVNNPSNIGYDPSPGAQHTNVQTQVTPPSQLYSYRLKPWLKDTIYINANGCGFQSLTNDNGVFNSINNKGLDGDLTVMIESDLTEKGNYELNGTKLNGYRLTIRPYGNTLRTITQDAIGDTQMVQLNGVKNFTIDGSYQGNGRYLRFVQKPLVSYKDSISAIRIYNSCDSIYIRNCVFDHNGNATIVDSSSSTIWIGRGTNKNIDLRGNLFRGGGGEFPCRHLVSTEGNNNATVIRNEFTNFKENGIRISSGNNWIIDSNHFYRTATYTGSGYLPGLAVIRVSGGGHLIKNNFIGGTAPGVAGGFMTLNNPSGKKIGIEIVGPAGSDSIKVTNNMIDNIQDNNTLSGGYSQLFAGIGCANNKALIKDNIVGLSSGGAYGIGIIASEAYGIYIQNSGVTIENNIVSGIRTLHGGIFSPYTCSMSGIYASVANTTDVVIRGNTISHFKNDYNQILNSASDAFGSYGIFVSGGRSFQIVRNKISDLRVSQSKIAGIVLFAINSTASSRIDGNRIYQLVNSGSDIQSDDFSNPTINGIVLELANNNCDVINNQISIDNDNLASNGSIKGINASSNTDWEGGLRVINNSVYIAGTASGVGGSGAFVIRAQKVPKVYNNIFYNERIGGTTGHFIYRAYYGAPMNILTFTKANRNFCVQADTTQFASWGFSHVKTSYRTWVTTTSLDDSSYRRLSSQVPAAQLFVDKANGNLNINTSNVLCWNLSEKALPFSGLTDDFDTVNVRSTSPTGATDIGSDEFITYTIPAAFVCVNGNKSITSSLSGTGYQWQVDKGAGFINITDNSNYTGSSASVLQVSSVPQLWDGYRYRCVVGGNYSDTTLLTVISGIYNNVSISGPSVLCTGTTASFTATTINGGNNPVYQWQVNGANVGTNSNSYSGNFSNNDQVKLLMTANTACPMPQQTTSNTIVVSIPPPVSANAGNDISICEGSVTTIGSVSQPATNYTWTPATGLNNALIAQPNASPAATTTYVLTASNSGGCTAKDTVTVTVLPKPAKPVAGPDASICKGESASLGSTPVPGISYSWIPATGLNNSSVAQPLATPQSSITYIVYGTSTNGCSEKDTVDIVIRNLPAKPNAGTDVSICQGNSVTIGGSSQSGITYLWTPVAGLSSGNIAQPIASPATTTNYVVTATNTENCLNRDTVLVTVNPLPATPIITVNGSVLSSSAATGNQWYKDGVAINGATGQNFSANSFGTYTVKVTTNGCSSGISNALQFIPTALGSVAYEKQFLISPNPVRDLLFITNRQGSDRYQLSVIDAMGRTVVNKSSLQGTISIDLSALATGSYLVRIVLERSGHEIKKMVIKE